MTKLIFTFWHYGLSSVHVHEIKRRGELTFEERIILLSLGAELLLLFTWKKSTKICHLVQTYKYICSFKTEHRVYHWHIFAVLQNAYQTLKTQKLTHKPLQGKPYLCQWVTKKWILHTGGAGCSWWCITDSDLGVTRGGRSLLSRRVGGARPPPSDTGPPNPTYDPENSTRAAGGRCQNDPSCC